MVGDGVRASFPSPGEDFAATRIRRPPALQSRALLKMEGRRRKAAHGRSVRFWLLLGALILRQGFFRSVKPQQAV